MPNPIKSLNRSRRLYKDNNENAKAFARFLEERRNSEVKRREAEIEEEKRLAEIKAEVDKQITAY
jgi:hypothetical protein